MPLETAWVRPADDHPPACPQCGRLIRWAAAISGGQSPPPPKPGSCTICTDCATILAFTGDMGVRRATAAEVAAALENPLHRQAYEAVLERLLVAR